ncbi:unnamed protein product [Anisakis simplex]|uniref:Membrane protein US9 n=1 Tax=Anisakis simplex TaxID=6269 RepID=A0A0M3K0B6_ANISI|nr:unnamed protein product [Anisakis simplex]
MTSTDEDSKLEFSPETSEVSRNHRSSYPVTAASSTGCTVEHSVEKHRRVSVVPIGGAWRCATNENMTARRMNTISSVSGERRPSSTTVEAFPQLGCTITDRRRICKIALIALASSLVVLVILVMIIVRFALHSP